MLKVFSIVIFIVAISISGIGQQIDVGVFGGYGFVEKRYDLDYSGAGAIISYKPKNALFSAHVEPGFVKMEDVYLFSVTTFIAFDIKLGEYFLISPGIGFVYREENHLGLAFNTSFQYSGKVLNYHLKAEGVAEGWKEETLFGTSSNSLASLWVTIGVSRTIQLKKIQN